MSTGNKLGTCMISLYFWCFSNLQDRWHYHCEADRSICQLPTSLELVWFCSTFDASQIYQSCNASKGHSFLSLCYQFKSRSDYSLNLFISMFVVKSIYRGFCLDLLATQPSWNWNEWILVICYLFTLFNQWASYYLFNPSGILENMYSLRGGPFDGDINNVFHSLPIVSFFPLLSSAICLSKTCMHVWFVQIFDCSFADGIVVCFVK